MLASRHVQSIPTQGRNKRMAHTLCVQRPGRGRCSLRVRCASLPARKDKYACWRFLVPLLDATAYRVSLADRVECPARLNPCKNERLGRCELRSDQRLQIDSRKRRFAWPRCVTWRGLKRISPLLAIRDEALLNPFHPPPGCHPHPAPGQNASSHSDRASIPKDRATPTSSPRPDRRPMSRSRKAPSWRW